MVPVRSNATEKLIYQFHELVEELSGLECSDMSLR